MISFPETLLRLVTALVLGALVGFERESREQTAGMRTNALVALGAALFTIISGFGFFDLLRYPHVQLDPTRIASYVIAGIGFLGGGAIFFVQEKERVRGLTTAAAIWIVAAIGMACGAGLILEAATTTVLALIVLILLRLVEEHLVPRRFSGLIKIQVEADASGGQFIEQVYEVCNRNGVLLETLDVRSEQGRAIISIGCRAKGMAGLSHLLGELRSLSEVSAVRADMQGANRKNALARDMDTN